MYTNKLDDKRGQEILASSAQVLEMLKELNASIHSQFKGVNSKSDAYALFKEANSRSTRSSKSDFDDLR